MKTKYILLSVFGLIFGVQTVGSHEKLQFEKKEIGFVVSTNPNMNISINLQFDYPIVQQDAALLNIREYILSEIFETPTDSIITDSVSLLSNFFGAPEDYSEEDRVRYMKDIVGNSLFANDNILSYSINNYSFSGGMHGYTAINYFVFDLKTGNRIIEEDIFDGDYKEMITEILLKELSKEDHFEDFYLDRVIPNGNFKIDEDGITYFFNTYEIAPYAYGNFEVFIPYEKIKLILQKESPVSSLCLTTK